MFGLHKTLKSPVYSRFKEVDVLLESHFTRFGRGFHYNKKNPFVSQIYMVMGLFFLLFPTQYKAKEPFKVESLNKIILRAYREVRIMMCKIYIG